MSKDVLGWRKKFGAIVPSTNTIVEPDFFRMTVPGVTIHTGLIHIRDQDLSSDEKMDKLLKGLRQELQYAVERVITAEPDYLVMGMSAETFWGGMEGNRQFVERIHEWSGGLGVATGAEACQRALQAFGAKRVAVVTPYQPIGDKNVIHFMSEIGVEVVRTKGLCRPTAIAIAETPEAVLREALIELDGDDIDALVQVGTNLSMVQLADEAERWLGKPVIAINAATWWMALRENGIEDKVYGCGRLLREF